MNSKLIKTAGILIFIILAGFAGGVVIRNTQQAPIESQENQVGI